MGFVHAHFLPGRNTSVRRGTRWLGVAQVRIELGAGRLSEVLPLQTRACRFDALCEADLALEHDPSCRSTAGLLAVLQAHYPGFSPCETVTVCDFRLPERQT